MLSGCQHSEILVVEKDQQSPHSVNFYLISFALNCSCPQIYLCLLVQNASASISPEIRTSGVLCWNQSAKKLQGGHCKQTFKQSSCFQLLPHLHFQRYLSSPTSWVVLEFYDVIHLLFFPLQFRIQFAGSPKSVVISLSAFQLLIFYVVFSPPVLYVFMCLFKNAFKVILLGFQEGVDLIVHSTCYLKLQSPLFYFTLYSHFFINQNMSYAPPPNDNLMENVNSVLFIFVYSEIPGLMSSTQQALNTFVTLNLCNANTHLL